MLSEYSMLYRKFEKKRNSKQKTAIIIIFSKFKLVGFWGFGDDVLEILEGIVADGDIVVTQGAGSVGALAKQLSETLAMRSVTASK